MKKVLLLSCSTGQGHNSCALAVKEYLEEQNISCEIKDALAFISTNVSRFMAWGHCFIFRVYSDGVIGIVRSTRQYLRKSPASIKC